jgi:CRISPR-associated protein Cmr3
LLFPGGLKLRGLEEHGAEWIWRGSNFSARLVSAAVARPETVSGWNLAVHCPKTAQRAVPLGSVYWFDGFEGKVDALKQLPEEGLWGLIENPDMARRAEGFNNFFLAAWPQI